MMLARLVFPQPGGPQIIKLGSFEMLLRQDCRKELGPSDFCCPEYEENSVGLIRSDNGANITFFFSVVDVAVEVEIGFVSLEN